LPSRNTLKNQSGKLGSIHAVKDFKKSCTISRRSYPLRRENRKKLSLSSSNAAKKLLAKDFAWEEDSFLNTKSKNL